MECFSVFFFLHFNVLFVTDHHQHSFKLIKMFDGIKNLITVVIRVRRHYLHYLLNTHVLNYIYSHSRQSRRRYNN